MNAMKLIARLLMAPVTPLYAFDPNDPADVALLDERIAAALAPISKKNKELLADLKKAKAGAEITPEQLAEVEAERDALQTQVADLGKANKALTKTAEDATKTLTSEQAYNQRLLVDNGLAAALRDAGVKNETHLKAAVALIKSSGVEIKVEADGDNRTAKFGGKALGDFVKEWSASDDGKTFVTAPANGGGGQSGKPGAGAAPGAGGDGKPVTANWGGTPAERTAAIAARFPDLPKE